MPCGPATSARQPEVGALLAREFRNVSALPGNGGGRRSVIAVRSRGCVLLRRGQGCTHCGLGRHRLWSVHLSEADIVGRFRHDLAARDAHPWSTLCLYTAGSFFDDSEIPPEAQRAILRAVAARPWISRVVFESRPEFVREARLKEVRELLGDRQIEVGLGLESIDAKVRNEIIGKGTTLSSYRRAVALLHQTGCKATLYVLVKPPRLTEGEALEEAWRTIQAAFAMGADAVSLEPVAVQTVAPLAQLYHRGEYRPPRLWTVVELARRAAPLGQVRVGGEVVVPKPIAAAANCPRCTPRVRQALREFEQTQDATVLERVTCACRGEWEGEVGGRWRREFLGHRPI